MTLATNLTHLPLDAWGHVFSWSEIKDIKKTLLISKVFDSIVENGCAAMITRYNLGKNKEGQSSFKRIIYLGDLIHKWRSSEIITPFLKESDGFDENQRTSTVLFASYVSDGINPCDYRPKLIDSNNKVEFESVEASKKDLFFSRVSVILTIKKQLDPLSIQNFLQLPPCIINTTNFGRPFSQMINLTPNIFPDHPGNEDLHHLIVNNVDDLGALLKNNPERADKLLQEDFLQIPVTQFQNIAYYYLCNYEVDRLYTLLKLMYERGRKFPLNEGDLATFQNILDLLSYEHADREEIFVKVLALFKNPIGFITGKDILSHVAENGNLSLLDKLQKEYDPGVDLTACFHYVKTAEVAESLFATRANDANGLLFDRSPLMTNLMKNNTEVAEAIASRNCTLENDKSLTLVRFLFSKSPNESKWFVLKELISRVASFVIRCIKFIAHLLLVSVAATITVLSIMILGLKIADQFGLFG